MIVVDIDTDAHAALVAVLERFTASHATKTTIVAMEWLLRFNHPKVADSAMIFAKLNATPNAAITVRREQEGKM